MEDTKEREVTLTYPRSVVDCTNGFPRLLIVDVDEKGELVLQAAKFEDKHAGCFEE